MGSLVPQGGGANALAAYGGVNPWAEAARGISDGAYLKFNGNTGDLTFGSDDEELPVGSRLVLDPMSLSFGFTCWVESAVLEEILVPVVDGKPPLEHELTDHGPYDEDDGWRESASISAVIVSYGEDDQDEAVGTKLLFKTSTGGQVRSLKKFSQAYGRVFMQHPGKLPIVEVQTESYMPKVKKHGKKWSLVLKIVGWVSEAEAEAMLNGDADGADDYEDEPAPVAKPRQRALPAPAAEEEEEAAPAPRRRAAPAPVEEEEEEVAPAPRRRAAPAPIEEEEEEVAPAPRRRAAPAPVEDEEEEVAPAPRRRAAAPAADEDEDEPQAPAPRGRSAGRGAPPASARLRRFD